MVSKGKNQSVHTYAASSAAAKYLPNICKLLPVGVRVYIFMDHTGARMRVVVVTQNSS